MNFFIDLIGYLAAVITNISMYPQAYSCYKIIRSAEYDKLDNMNLNTYYMQVCGCILWLIYAINKELYPVISGCIINTLPNTYIIYIILIYKEKNNTQIVIDQQVFSNENTDDTKIITSTSSNIHENNEFNNIAIE